MKTNKPVKNKHHDLIIEYARQKASGELAVGWWEWRVKSNSAENWTCLDSTEPAWLKNKEYDFEMTKRHPKHPNNLIEKINLKGCPLGVKYGSWTCLGDDRWLNFSESLYCFSINPSVEGTDELSSDWLVYNCEQPVPRGLRVEVKYNYNSSCTNKGYSHVMLHTTGQVYRVIGIGSGFKL